MEDEEIEKFYTKIEYVFGILVDKYYLGENERKAKIKEILEEVYNRGYEDWFNRR